MTDLIRDTAFGHLVLFVSRRKYLKFAEEADPSIWTRYIDEKKSGYLAYHGSSEPPEDGFSLSGLEGVRTRENQYALLPPSRVLELRKTISNQSGQSDGRPTNLASGVKVNPEIGKDIHLVSWYGDHDPENVSALSACIFGRD